MEDSTARFKEGVKGVCILKLIRLFINLSLMLYHRKYHFYQASARIPQLQRRCGWQIFTAHKGDYEMKYGFLQSDTFQMQENGLERGLGNGHLGLDNSRTHIMRPTSERDIGLHETDF